MQAQAWLKLRDLFEAASDLGEPERGAYLDRECAGEAGLRAQIERTLEVDPGESQFLRRAVSGGIELASETSETALEGTRLGSYPIVRKLGSGGMGTVYLAERADGEFHKQVAIKLISGTFVSSAAAARFRSERQILATLDHPNCCRLLDGGLDEGGAPYLAMEYVEGTPIDRHCSEKQLDEAARLRLVLQLCAAMQYAHQNLIAHRDIKLGNVPVTREGVVKLLDFGIAKLVGSEIGGAQDTRQMDVIATPGYASPEQLLGKPVTTASDTYSLGKLMATILPTGPATREG